MHTGTLYRYKVSSLLKNTTNTSPSTGPKQPGVIHSGHNTLVTAMVLSVAEPHMLATACQEGSVVEEPSTNGLVEDEGALVHVWRPSDGSLVTVLQGDSKDQIITSMSFSPKGRQLAFLADAATIYLFNWVKGTWVHIALIARLVLVRVAVNESMSFSNMSVKCTSIEKQ